jgi:putative ABC transport system substrate-binding protein
MADAARPWDDRTVEESHDGWYLAFRRGLYELGWIPGKNLELLWRSAEGDYSRMPGILEELLRLPVDVLVVVGNSLAKLAQSMTQSVPIVLVTSSDPVGSGLVRSLAHPGGNVTGLALDRGDGRDLTIKRLSILRELVPGLSRVAHLAPGGKVKGRDGFDGLDEIALPELDGLVLMRYRVENVGALDAALADARARKARAVYFPRSLLYAGDELSKMSSCTTKHDLPAIAVTLRFPARGGLAAYDTLVVENYRKAAGYVDRILKGALPGDLPMEEPSRFVLWLNRSAARAIGLTIPASVLLQADRVLD